jgi:Fe-S cluster assembly protein SufD
METIQKITTTDKILSLIESIATPLWAEAERVLAKDAFCKQGIPNRKHEEYKYTNIDLILKDEFVLNATKTIVAKQIESSKFLTDSFIAVVVNGIFSPELSLLQELPKGLIVTSLADAAKTHAAIFDTHYGKYVDVNSDAFIALNTAMAKDGVFIHVAKGAVIEKPIHVLHVSSADANTIINPRNLVIVDSTAQAKIIESFETIDSKAKIFNNAITEITVAKNTVVEHYKIQDENEAGFLMNTLQINQQDNSVFTTNTITLSGSLVRNNLTIVLDGEHIEANLNGLYLTRDHQLVDNHTLVDHRKPNCNSNELYKGIIDEKSTATFNGKIFVRKDAQKTNAFQSNKNILLSDDGSINTKPQLEIYADDVKCSHGTSTGKLDEDKIFYLSARGISELSAKKLLMHAFASEVINTIKIDELRDYVEAKVALRFE